MYCASLNIRRPLPQPVQRGSRVEGGVGGQPELRRGAHLEAHDQGPHAGHSPRISGQGDLKNYYTVETAYKVTGYKVKSLIK